MGCPSVSRFSDYDIAVRRLDSQTLKVLALCLHCLPPTGKHPVSRGTLDKSDKIVNNEKSAHFYILRSHWDIKYKNVICVDCHCSFVVFVE